jgi:ABC-type glycerol-3-phosphate transport system substrate-binding protein
MADVSEFVKDDPEWAGIPQVLKDSFSYSGKILGIPSGIFVMGYFVNQDLYEAANLDAPAYGITVDDWETAVTSLNNIEKGILGLDETGNVTGWVANALNPELKYYSYDGSKLNYNSTEFKTAIQKTIDMKPYTWQGLTEEQKANFKSTGPWELFLNQEVGMRWDASWALGSYVSSATFNWDFIGTPGGNQAVVFDALGVSKTSANLQEAFNFAKWMSFSKEGYAKEAEIAKAMNGAPSRMPVSIDADSVALFKTFFDKPGINLALDNLDNSMIESMAKIVPGYIQARWEGKPGIDIGDNKDVTIGWMFDNVITGQFKYEDYSAKLEEFANKILADASAAINK